MSRRASEISSATATASSGPRRAAPHDLGHDARKQEGFAGGAFLLATPPPPPPVAHFYSGTMPYILSGIHTKTDMALDQH
jgi:hypothetical protein